MTKDQIIKKLTSRKFIVAVISIISGICLLLGADCDTVSVISGGAMIILPSVAYCIAEGKIDAENVKAISSAIKDTVNALDDLNNGNHESEVNADDEG